MTPPRPRSPLAVATELEARDAAIATDVVHVTELAARAHAIGGRSAELESLLEAIPRELAGIEAAEADARADHARAEGELAASAERAAALQRRRRPPREELAQALRDLTRARDAAADATSRLERLATRRRDAVDAERAGQAEAEGVAVEARHVAEAVRGLARVSDAGRGEPGSNLPAVADWAARTRAALFVVRGSLEAERERILREASELGASVLGEPLGGSSVALVRRRLEQALRS